MGHISTESRSTTGADMATKVLCCALEYDNTGLRYQTCNLGPGGFASLFKSLK